MLGLPASPGVVGWILLGLGLVAAAAAGGWAFRRGGARLAERALVVCATVTLGATPFFVWRIIEDLRYTAGLDSYARGAAGPIQSYLPGYLLDGARRIVPREATYAVVVGDGVPYAAQQAFPSFALTVLFPGVSVSDPQRADWIVAWGADPRRVARVSRVVVARRASGPLPAVVVAKVRR